MKKQLNEVEREALRAEMKQIAIAMTDLWRFGGDECEREWDGLNDRMMSIIDHAPADMREELTVIGNTTYL